MAKTQIMRFRSRVDGIPVVVKIASTSISWIALPRGNDDDRRLLRMVPMKSISSIVVVRETRRKARLIVHTPLDAVEFVVERFVAREAQVVLARIFAPGYRNLSENLRFPLKVSAGRSDLFSV